MQLSNLVLRLGGSQLHTVPITNATPAEILVLQRIHGDDAVTDIRPTKVDKTRRHQSEYERLAHKYDRGSTFQSAPGEESKSIMASLFPGAMKKLPLTLKEIGLGHVMSSASIAAVDNKIAATVPSPDEGEEVELASGEEDGEPVEDEAEFAAGGFGSGNLAT